MELKEIGPEDERRTMMVQDRVQLRAIELVGLHTQDSITTVLCCYLVTCVL
jgi:hypothetical protein